MTSSQPHLFRISYQTCFVTFVTMLEFIDTSLTITAETKKRQL